MILFLNHSPPDDFLLFLSNKTKNIYFVITHLKKQNVKQLTDNSLLSPVSARVVLCAETKARENWQRLGRGRN